MNNPKFDNYTLSPTPIPVLVFQTPSLRLKMSSQQPPFTTPPPKVSDTILLSFPRPTPLLITLNRPKSLNCISSAGHHELDALYTWLDTEPSLSCAILTGRGRAFCAGADLKEWDGANSSAAGRRPMPASGFGGLSRRSGKKPVIAAVNGICFGGGCEMVVNADMVVASESATFALPEVKRGVVALAGALTRLVRTVGRQRALEMALTGRTLSAAEAERWGLVNKVVGKGGEGLDSEVVKAAIQMAEMIAENSPDSVIVSREGIKLGWEGVGAEEGTKVLEREWYPRMDRGENMKEGVRAFVEKRKPRWVASKL
jgi:enoyl-CoA hydratase/carnithine racemase